MSKIVLALGGNAILRSDQKGTYAEQLRNIESISRQIARLVRDGHKILITHGNGPQVGALLIQQDEAKDVSPEQPMDVLGAMTQGQIGYMLQLSLTNELARGGLPVPVAALVNMVEVDANDKAFEDPTKPVGPFYTRKEARKIALLKDWDIKKVIEGRHDCYRHVVPSPTPIRNLEAGVVGLLMDNGVIVVASGGGGIPVSRVDGDLAGIEAVIDKDLSGELLAEGVGADVFMLMTDVEKVKLNFGKDDETDLDEMNAEQAMDYLEQGHFPPGSMGPKVRAAVDFVENGGQMVIISSIEKIIDSFEGKTGTRIVKK